MSDFLPPNKRSGLSLSRALSLGEAMKDEKKLDSRIDGMSTLGRLGAGAIFAYNKDLPALPAADTDVEQKTDEAIASKNEELIEKWMSIEREKAVFRLAAESGRTVSYVSYGTKHKWTKSLLDWNNENPDHRFSVLTLTTDLVRGYPD
jgi:hypothetical protein